MNGQNKSILIVDDDIEVGSLLSKVFSSALSCEVVCVSDGKLGLDMWRVRTFDLIITDLQRRGLDGKAMIDIMREEDPAVKIVVFTGGIENDVPGAIAVFHKPAKNILQFAKEVGNFL